MLTINEREHARTSYEHVHDCANEDARCSCGYVFRVPPICVSIEIIDRGRSIVDTAFNTDGYDTAIHALEEAIAQLRNSQC